MSECCSLVCRTTVGEEASSGGRVRAVAVVAKLRALSIVVVNANEKAG